MKSASHIEFYTKYKISPVRQDISDLARHFDRRESLYRQVGILPQHLKNKRVLEVGPGSGYNSLYTATLKPARYLLVEGNPTGVEHINELFSDFSHLREKLEIRQLLLEEFQPTEKFDFVFCEGVLSGVPNPQELLDKLSSCLAPGGMLILTCVDHISSFPETLRRLFAQLLVSPEQELHEQVKQLLPVFTSHLRTLKGMSRRHDDWLIDNLIHPASVIPNISFPEVITHLQDTLQFFASAPHFITDWRWYKDIAGDAKDCNRPAIRQYWLNAHNLLDYRIVILPIAEQTSKELYAACTTIRALVRKFEHDRDMEEIQKILGELQKIIKLAKAFSPKTAEAMQEAYTLLSNMPIDTSSLEASKNFGSLFGRGQQYISMTKS